MTDIHTLTARAYQTITGETPDRGVAKGMRFARDGGAHTLISLKWFDAMSAADCIWDKRPILKDKNTGDYYDQHGNYYGSCQAEATEWRMKAMFNASLKIGRAYTFGKDGLERCEGASWFAQEDFKGMGYIAGEMGKACGEAESGAVLETIKRVRGGLGYVDGERAAFQDLASDKVVQEAVSQEYETVQEWAAHNRFIPSIGNGEAMCKPILRRGDVVYDGGGTWENIEKGERGADLVIGNALTRSLLVKGKKYAMVKQGAKRLIRCSLGEYECLNDYRGPKCGKTTFETNQEAIDRLGILTEEDPRKAAIREGIKKANVDLKGGPRVFDDTNHPSTITEPDILPAHIALKRENHYIPVGKTMPWRPREPKKVVVPTDLWLPSSLPPQDPSGRSVLGGDDE